MFNQAYKDITEAKNYYINELKKYEKMPYSLSNSSIKIFDTLGKALIIEFGRGRTGKKIKFKEHFNNFPYVQITSSDPTHYNPYLYGDRKVTFRRSLNVKELTKEYFIVYYGLPNTITVDENQIEFNWLAIGY